MILKLRHRASSTNLIKNNGIITIYQINKLELCSFMYVQTHKKLVTTMLSQFISIQHRW